MRKITCLCVVAFFSMVLFTVGCGGVGEKGAADETPEMDPDQKKLMEQTMKGGAPERGKGE